MGETGNTADVARKVSKDIFRKFGWHMHPRCDDNFDCVSDSHRNSSGGDISQHPTDVVFSYQDPYLGKQIKLLTDLKSYGEQTIKHTKLRAALRSLALSVECAGQSEQWREKFGALPNEPHEVRGFLFVHNHDGLYKKSFYEELQKVNTHSLPLAANSIIHYVGPDDIQRLYTIATDISRLKGDGELSDEYTFYYPDLMMRRRHGDIWEQAATFESLAGPFLIIRHKAATETGAGYLVYYNRPCASIEEFEYLLDCFSRYQLLDSTQQLRIRVVHPDADENMKSRFDNAVRKYSKAWGFDEARTTVLSEISIERLPVVVANYNPGDMGWDR